MSYDITIRSDATYSEHADLESLKSFISRLSSMVAEGDLERRRDQRTADVLHTLGVYPLSSLPLLDHTTWGRAKIPGPLQFPSGSGSARADRRRQHQGRGRSSGPAEGQNLIVIALDIDVVPLIATKDINARIIPIDEKSYMPSPSVVRIKAPEYNNISTLRSADNRLPPVFPILS